MIFAMRPPYLYFIAASGDVSVRGRPRASAERPDVSDIFDEVDEEVRRERLNKLWDQYGTHFIALAVLVVAAVAGWRCYDYWQTKKAAEIGAQFHAAGLLSDQGKHEDAEHAFATIAPADSAPYRLPSP